MLFLQIQLSRIKPPWVAKGRPTYQICPRIVPITESSCRGWTGARTLADIKARALQARGARVTTAIERRPPLPSEGGVARVEVAVGPSMREVAETAAVVMVVRPVATLSPGEPQAPLERVRQIYSEHNYCRLVL